MVKNILGKIKLDNTWVTVDIGDFNSCYMIGIKENKAVSDTIDPQSIQLITFEIGIDSGIKDKPITISRFSLNFDELTSSDESINQITAFVKLTNLPNIFYLKAVSMYNGTTLKTGETTIGLNVNPLNLS